MACARLSKRRISDRFAGSFADRLHRQMGLSDLESSRDGSGAYNCHRRANERSLVSELERGPRYPPPPPPSLSTTLVLAGWVSLSRASPSSRRSSSVSSFNSRSLLLPPPPPVAASLVDSFATRVKAVNRECACNYATWTFYSSWYPPSPLLPSLNVAYTFLVYA